MKKYSFIGLITILGLTFGLWLGNPAIAQGDGSKSVYLPFKAPSAWNSANVTDQPNVSYAMAKISDISELFAIQDKAFVKTNPSDTWFVYGLFGKVKALEDPNSPKYTVWQGRHDGIDLVAPLGTDVLSATDGEVVFADQYIGNTIIVKCQDGLYITYGHLNKMFKKVGDKATIGELIGEVGNSGGVTNPHLHFEIDQRIENRTFLAINPLSFFNEKDLIIPDFAANHYSDPSNADNFYWINPLADLI